MPEEPETMPPAETPTPETQTSTPETPAATEQTPPENPSPESPEAQPAKSANRKKLMIILGIFILVVVAAVVAWLLMRGNKKPVNAATKKAATVQKAATQPQTLTSLTSKFQTAPTELSTKPNLFTDYATLFGSDCASADTSSCTPSVSASDVQYYQIGTTQDGHNIIIANIPNGLDSESFVVLQTGANNYSILGKFSGRFGNDQNTPQIIADFKKALDPSATLDMITDLPDLVLPSDITFKNTAFKFDNDPHTAGTVMINGLSGIRGTFWQPVNTSQVTKLGNYGAYNVYQVKVQDHPNYSVNEIYLTINQVYTVGYELKDSLASDKPPHITWSDNSTNTTENYSYQAAGCGSATGYITAKNIDASSLTKIGTGPSGQVLYELPTNSPLFQQIYNEDYAGGTNLDAGLKGLTADQMQSRHTVFLVKDGMGEYVVYKDNQYFITGGCAKPVIYLYPTHSQNVNVAVGAKVTKSVPLYTAGGWQNVLAQPDGQLTYQGQSYDSLYWEGKGLGLYPSVDAGTVVPSGRAVDTIRQQLAEQGLNSKEVNDFVTYWQPRLPQTPFVRLTWFNTDQLNQLAPLKVAPAPQTEIRTFLDFQGLDLPLKLPAQHFSAPARQGFTLVEWGGLDRSQR